MSSSPSIELAEFDQFIIGSREEDNFTVVVREHPEFGTWEEKTLELSNVRVTEHKVKLNRTLDVEIADDRLTDHVHHCMCVEGSLGAHFDDHQLRADLKPGTYHYLRVDSNNYRLAMSQHFHNVHIEVAKDYYTSLLSDQEEWSSLLKGSILNRDICYPGLFSLTPQMVKVVTDIFCSPLSGSLKKLLIEAKIHELVALQLNQVIGDKPGKSISPRHKDLMFAIRDYLAQSFLEEHTLKGICVKFGTNEFTLKHRFKETFQCTVFEYIHSLRLEYAHSQLSDTDTTIQAVGTKVGYKYPNHFSTAFKKKFGFTPGRLLRRG